MLTKVENLPSLSPSSPFPTAPSGRRRKEGWDGLDSGPDSESPKRAPLCNKDSGYKSQSQSQSTELAPLEPRRNPFNSPTAPAPPPTHLPGKAWFRSPPPLRDLSIDSRTDAIFKVTLLRPLF